MNRVLEYLEQMRQSLSRQPFILFVQDGTQDPWHRLSFAPCLAPMTMGFADLMMYGLRDTASKDRLQQLLNAHTFVDDQHWRLFLRDLETLGLNGSLSLSNALQLLWGEHSAKSRQLIYTVMALVRGASPILRLVTLEAIEVAADVGFSRFREVGREIAARTGQQFLYFGQSHQDQEDQHEAMASESIRSLIASYAWTEEEEEQARGLVDEVYACFVAMWTGLLAYALKARDEGPLWPLPAGPHPAPAQGGEGLLVRQKQVG
ncbi:MAG: hypothetical protein JXB05_00015 [Myxococcaceae bacterium]|nr:hypothetical protein [Myxococcaceae bacterium]